jgi:hypothetical protein
MGLSRLDNFLKSTRGTILYVDPSSLDSTDSIENQGNSLTRPFKTIQRALIEAARFSYQRGLDNDRFNKTTILLYPGDHTVDNRPGYIPDGANNFRLRSGATTDDLVPFDLTTNFDLATNNNALYKLNSIHGGVIIPRGVSIVGMDLRKTKIRPLYVPNPENDNIERSAVFRVTGGCYLWQFSILDADPNGICFKDYTTNTFVPNFSHHKLTGFEYADGVNDVSINDDFQTYSTDRTDLDMYYEKVGIAYGQSSGRPIEPDYPSASLDIQTVVDEYRIVGSRGAEVGISSIKAGDGVTSGTQITVTLSEPLAGLNVDTPISINGVGSPGYDGQYVVSEVNSTTQIVYEVQNSPANALPSIAGATLNISVDTVTSASPYIFNISLRSVYGMCGLLADGNKASGFKSMVVAQFTGIGLQKDDNAFVKYDSTSGTYKDQTSYDNLHTDSLARFKPEYENFHIKATNNAFLQLVSIFAIGYAQHFVSESGGDLSITNSNSNFGAKSLIASGFRSEAFPRDDIGYVTHVIPPKEIETSETSIEFVAVDVAKTVGIASTNRLYLYNELNEDVAPSTVIDGYRLGAKVNDTLNVQISQAGVTTQYSARIIMPNTQYTGTELSSQKTFTVGRSVAGINSISANVFTLTSNHSFLTGETVRIFGENGHVPDGLNSNQVYNVITNVTDITLANNQVKIAQSLNDAVRDNPITVNSNGGILTIVSRVSDKSAGEIGHPVQWDGSQWYVNVSTAATENTIYSTVTTLGTAGLGEATPRTYITRNPDTRSLIDTIYRLRYVLPKDSTLSARPPLDGYILEESNNVIGAGTTEIQKYFDPTNSSTLSNSTELRNPRFIAGANWTANTANIITELPHDLVVGSQVEVINVTSTNNTVGVANSAFNGTFTVTGISSTKHFSYSLTNNPGTFTNNTGIRTSGLPAFRRKKYTGTYQIYRSQEIQKYIPGQQDGVYHLIITNASNSPTVAPFSDLRFSQPIQNLYPQTNRDNPVSDPAPTASFALPDPIGQVVVNDAQRSVTKESLGRGLIDFNVGFALTDIKSNAAGTAHTFYSKLDHGLAGITSVSIVSGGLAYGSGSSGNAYNARLVGFAGSTTGANATAVVTFNGSGTITAVKIMDGGSAYGIGNTLTIAGIATTTGFTQAVVQVTSITDNLNDSIQLDGIIPAANNEYNTLYKVTGISTGNTKQFEVQSSVPINNPTQVGLGVTATIYSNTKIVGKALGISTFTYSPIVGVATYTFYQSHGFRVDNKLYISGVENNFFNGDFIVKKVNSLTSLVVNVGLGTTVIGAGGSITAYRYGFASSGGDITTDNENLAGRFNFEYAGITTTLNTAILANASDSTPLVIIGADVLGFKLGDYIQIDSEIFRIKSDVTGSSVSVFRGLFGTTRETHTVNSVVRRVSVRPIELRRNSIIRASGHTFEYLGFGPGNYSTALPERQDRIISPQEELIAQNSKVDGGISIFTAMNSDGDFYTGNKKVNSATGQEEVFDAPVPSVTGEEIDTGNISVGFDVLTSSEASITRSLRVEGGSDSNLVSEFDGPVIFNNKITSTSNKGIEANSVFLQGDAVVSRRVSISKNKPSLAGNYGDINFNSEPTKNGFVGWAYVTQNQWEPFGFIGGSGVGISSNGTYVGFSTLVNIQTTGIDLTAVNDSTSGITTVNFNASPKIGISSGPLNNFVGLATQINFVGYGVTLTTAFNQTTGVATVTVDTSGLIGIGGSFPGLPNFSLQYNDSNKFNGVPIFLYNSAGNNLVVEGSSSNTIFKVTQTGTGNAFYVEDTSGDPTPFVVTNDGSVGIGSSVPTAQLDITATSQPAINIRSTSGSGNIIRVDNTASDTTPFIVDVSGNVGINTIAAIAALDVVGNAAVTGAVRIYESDRSNYVGLQAGSLGSNLTFTLPTGIGTAGYVLYTSGSGVLDWKVASNQEVKAGTGITISYATVGYGVTVATITNSGVTKIIAGVGVSITPASGTGDVTITANTGTGNIYPFTTRGFSIPF